MRGRAAFMEAQSTVLPSLGSLHQVHSKFRGGRSDEKAPPTCQMARGGQIFYNHYEYILRDGTRAPTYTYYPLRLSL